MTSVIGRLGGFTLIELLVVLAILTLVAAALPLSSARILPARALDAAELQLLADLKAVRREALRDGKTASLVVDPDGRGYRVGARARALVSPLTLRVAGTDAAASVNLASVAFHSDGSARGVILHLRHGRRDRRVAVSALTGTLARLPAPASP